MIYNEKCFISISDLKAKLQKDNYEIFVFGVGFGNKMFFDSLNAMGITFEKYVDNDIKKQNTIVNGKLVIAPDELVNYENPLIIISISFFAEVFEQLSEMNIKEVFLIKDLHLAYPYQKVIREQQLLEEYYLIKNKSNKILVKVFDGFGDNIVKFNILKKISSFKNADDYYFIVDRQSNYDIYTKLFNNVFMLDKIRFELDDKYRYNILKKVNEQYFTYSICFCATPYYHANYDPINCHNTNIDKNYSLFEFLKWKNGRSKNEILDDMVNMARHVFKIPVDADLNCKNVLNEYIKNEILPTSIPPQSISVGMGGISWQHIYDVKKFSKVVQHFINNGYSIIFLGYGQSDEEYYDEVIKNINISTDKIINLCSKLDAFKSLKALFETQLYIGLDSALAHGAYAMDKNAVILMSGNNFSAKFKHVDKKMKYLTEQVSCLHCNQCIYGNYNGTEDRKGECVSLLSPEKIINAVESLLKEKEII